ncbi:cell wall-binding repeat-containing protein [Herbiconiux sp. P18]|uniref:cell wall-binding repeat-containing protein n=1 Tax=Herbiconiux liangxiaofengii TaxID=3342795 RepID=UPI0035B86F43
MSPSIIRPVVAALLASLSLFGMSAPAFAEESVVGSPPTNARFEEVTAVLPNVESYGLAIDNASHRVFTHDVRDRTVRTYDISGDAFTWTGGIDVGSVEGKQHGLLFNDIEQEVYLLDQGVTRDELVVVDVGPSPASPKRVDLGALGAFRLGVDTAAHRVVILNARAPHVVILDLDDGSRTAIDTGAVPVSVAVDPGTQTVFVASSVDSSLATIRRDGSWTKTPLSNPPTEIAVVRNQLLVATEVPSNRLDAFDVVTMAKRGTSEGLSGRVVAIAADVERHSVFVAYDSFAPIGIEALREDSLSILGGGPSGSYGELVLNTVDHQLVVLRNGIGAKMTLLRPVVTPVPSVDRVGGADRFAVAAEASRVAFEPGAAPVAYVASGSVFADALSGAAAAGVRGGPMLLVTKGGIPDVTAAELRRLQPGEIVVLGGTASVSGDVEAALRRFGPVSRIEGADRYSLSSSISVKTFPAGADVAYLASGEVFSDALSASPLSGREVGPVLLTRKEMLPPSVAAEIARLNARYVYVLGGEATVSSAVVAEIEKSAAVIRIDGSDRFAVSAAASSRMFRAGSHTVYIASGEVFPDALAGSPAAIREGAPVLLVRRTDVPAEIDAELNRLAPYRIVVLGGSNTIAESVVSQLKSYLPD